jgi:amino acid transporter
MASVSSTAPGTHSGQLRRTIDWKGAFWVASGVPALVLFSIGGVAGTVGVPAFAVWAVSMLFGFVQSFTYAEIAGLFPNKSGGASVYGVLGLAGMLDASIIDGSGVAAAMAGMVGGGALVHGVLVLLLILALLLSIMTAMAGSSRTLYQGSVDGWLPRYLSHVNSHGAPTRAMWTDLCFNLILLSFASSDVTAYFLILAISNCGYIIFNFLNLNAGWIHRIDSGHVRRPWKAPTVVLAAGTVLAFVNAGLMGAGAKVWNPNALSAGLIAAALIIPVFWFRHYVQDGGKFPDAGSTRHRGGRDGRAQGRPPALPHAHRRRRRDAGGQLDLPVAPSSPAARCCGNNRKSSARGIARHECSPPLLRSVEHVAGGNSAASAPDRCI